MKETLDFTLNGNPTNLTVDTDRTLLWVLRTDLDLTGTKYGCGEGLCGACTVLVDGEAVRSCQVDARFVKGKKVVTIEGLATKDGLHPLQKSFVEHDALQCGYCTPGMILQAHALLSQNPEPTLSEIKKAMNENLCRCGAYNRIVQAIQSAAGKMNGTRLSPDRGDPLSGWRDIRSEFRYLHHSPVYLAAEDRDRGNRGSGCRTPGRRGAGHNYHGGRSL